MFHEDHCQWGWDGGCGSHPAGQTTMSLSKFYTTTELVLAISMSELEIRIDRAAAERIPTSLLELTTAPTLRFHGWPRQR